MRSRRYRSTISRPRRMSACEASSTATDVPRAMRSSFSGSRVRPSRTTVSISRYAEIGEEARGEAIEKALADETGDRLDLAREHAIGFAPRRSPAHDRVRRLDRLRGPQRAAEVDPLRRGEQLDCDDVFEVRVHAQKPAGAVRRHAHMVFLID